MDEFDRSSLTGPTYAQIASDFSLWGEYFDTSGIDDLESFESIGFDGRMEVLIDCLGEYDQNAGDE